MRESTPYWDGISETTLSQSVYDTSLNVELSGKFQGNLLTVSVVFAGLFTTASANEGSTSCSVRVHFLMLIYDILQYCLYRYIVK